MDGQWAALRRPPLSGKEYAVIPQLLISAVCLGSIYGLLALGYSLIYKASGLMNFAMGDLLSLGAFLGFTFYKLLGIPFAITLILVVVLMFMLGILIEKSVISTLLKKDGAVVNVLLATIAMSYILQNGMLFAWGPLPQGFPTLIPELPYIEVFGLRIQIESVFCVVMAGLCMLGIHLFINKTKFGTAMRAAALDPMAAGACGINIGVTKGITWGITCGLAALSGILIGPVLSVSTILGVAIANKSFASAVSGGYGNMYGAMIGGILIGIAETFSAAYISSVHKELIVYCILLVFLFVKPTGLFNERTLED